VGSGHKITKQNALAEYILRWWYMDAGISPARQIRARAQHRHELRSLTYLTLDDANGGVVRNLTYDGMGAQVVAAVHPRQQLKIRFELRYPRLRVETRGEVVWATFSGECGIRFLDLPPELTQKINEWIFGDLLERISLHVDPEESMFAGATTTEPADSMAVAEQEDGLMVSEAPVKVIPLPNRSETAKPSPFLRAIAPQNDAPAPPVRQLDWLSQPLSGRGLAWAIHTLVVLAGILLFVLVFLSITRDAPPWPVAMVAGSAALVAVLYWGFFQIFGGLSLGERLARLAAGGEEEHGRDRGPRFR
jgi:hypothetical protein